MASVANVTLVIAAFLLLIAVVQPAAVRLRLPYTVLLAAVGVMVGALSSFLLYTPLTNLFDDIVRPVVELPINSSVFLTVFLPVLLFDAALPIDVREIARDAAPILTLAIVAVFAAAAAIGLGLAAAGVPIVVALLLGVIVATTDPAAVVGIFRELGAPPRLTRLLEGESLLNDAAAIVLFGVLVEMLTRGTPFALGPGLLRFGETFLGGLAVGAVAGRLFGAVLPLLGGSRTAEVTLSIALPYIVYLMSEEPFHISGVVAVATAGLTAGAFGRVRLRPSNWRHLERIWEQTGFWASSLIFLIAATLMPHLLEKIQPRHFWLLPIVVVAAFLSRAAVLFGILPLLSGLRLSQRVNAAYKVAITWGGLRGAVTLALALAVTENSRVDGDAKDLVAVLATGFVMFTLLVNGLTLRPLIRLLKLDHLSPLDQAVRSEVLALSLGDVGELVHKTAQEYRLPTAAARAATAHYEERIAELEGRPGIEDALCDEDRVKVGLVALANRERRIILDHHDQASVSGVAIERLLHNTNVVLDAARSEGRAGYNRAALELLAFPRGFRIAHFLHRAVHLGAPLQRQVSIRFETLLSRRLALEELGRVVGHRLHALLGETAARQLDDIVAERASATADALDALRLQYPEHAAALEQRFLEQSGQRLLLSRYQDLFEEGLIGGELFHALARDSSARPLARRLPPLDLGLRSEELIGSFAMFRGLEPAELKALMRLFRPRLLVPDERLIRKGGRGREMFFISSGAVEVVLPKGRVRLGSGQFVGEMALLSGGRRQADVISLGYGRALGLAAADFRRFLARFPHAKEEIERTAGDRAQARERLEA